MMRLLLPLVLLICTSCIQLGGEPAATHHFLLTGLSPDTPSVSSDNLTIDIKVIDFPDYLKQKNMVTRNRDNSIKIASAARWADPLPDSLMRVLRRNLYQLLPEATVTVSPWEQRPAEALQVKLLINDFSGRFGDQVNIDINWLVRKAGSTIDRGNFSYQHPLGQGYSNLALELSRGLDIFSHEIAEELAAH
ncbi:MAG: membrane integrity-associated transporter subunit PqiC [Desulfuromonadales bacterium]|nr:membrane integrity-associated transporter subunit PqiC [Desulfuromonadales bacterium]MBN2793432.1 membrane integrity-associated transporter subunit PqiC [Desulfuromonadales bacterium]